MLRDYTHEKQTPEENRLDNEARICDLQEMSQMKDTYPLKERKRMQAHIVILLLAHKLNDNRHWTVIIPGGK